MKTKPFIFLCFLCVLFLISVVASEAFENGDGKGSRVSTMLLCWDWGWGKSEKGSKDGNEKDDKSKAVPDDKFQGFGGPNGGAPGGSWGGPGGNLEDHHVPFGDISSGHP
uniref:Uncharacterized protein LOC101490128 n=1 Tax=Cicer arietinum TaxID=3827 RepID=A0A1S3DYK2_CICAR|nr:uncharacterized protein LOC101490128 [Cicer arietinum]